MSNPSFYHETPRAEERRELLRLRRENASLRYALEQKTRDADAQRLSNDIDTVPSPDVIRAHSRVGGMWLVTSLYEHRRRTYVAPPELRNVLALAKKERGRVCRWVAIDARGCPCARPLAEPSTVSAT